MLAWRLPRQHSTLPRNDKLIYDVWHTWLTSGGRLKLRELGFAFATSKEMKTYSKRGKRDSVSL